MSTNLFGVETSGAVFSPDGKHRVRLWRVWDPTQPVLVWCLLNPSIASGERSDLTLAKCIGFAKRNGYGGVILVNLFTLVATNPDELQRQLHDANVWDADEHIRWACSAPVLAKVAAGWGSKPWASKRALYVLNYLRSLRQGHVLCLGTTRDGQPRHPSRLGYDTPLIGGLFLLILWLERRTHLLQQVQHVRDRLTAAARPTFRTTVQLNDGTQMRFDASMPLAAGDLVEADNNGKVRPADLLSNQRVIGVVVSCELRLL